MDVVSVRLYRAFHAVSTMQATRARPTGITILVVLEAVVSGLLILGGLALAILGPFLGMGLSETMGTSMPGLAGFVVTFIGVVLLLIGSAGFVVAWGLWTGRGWAWTLAFVLAVLGIVIDVFRLPMSIVGILINGLIIWYLWQPHVKAFYRRGALQEPYQPTAAGTPPSQPAQLQPMPGRVIYCTKCGTANSLDSRFCRNCGTGIKA